MTTRSDEPSVENQKLIEARAYINSAPTIEERNIRKQEMYHILYGHPQTLVSYLAEKKETIMSRPPDFYLKVMNKMTGQKSGKIGAARLNSDRSITLVVDFPHSVEDNKDFLYTLFKVQNENKGQPT